VVNGRIDGGFGPDMAAAVAMNDLMVRELFQHGCGWFVWAATAMLSLPRAAFGRWFLQGFVSLKGRHPNFKWKESDRKLKVFGDLGSWGSAEFDDFRSRRQRKSFRSDTKEVEPLYCEQS